MLISPSSVQDTDALEAKRTADDLISERTTQSLAAALRQVFGENQDARRFIDVTRIPLICQSINGIHESLKEIQRSIDNFDSKYVTHELFSPYKSVLNIIGGLVIVAVVGGLLTLVIIGRSAGTLPI